jgi:type I restriction enzyme, S subunit
VTVHWSQRRLGEIFDIARGGSPRPIEKFITDDEEGLNWIKIGDASASGKFIERTKEKITREGLSKSRYVEPGDFLLTNSMSFGRPYIMATDGCIHDGWLVLKPRTEKLVHPDYFYYLLGSDVIYRQFASRAGGSTVKNLNTEIVSSIEVRLPPLAEQRRIAAILDKADALRRKRKRAIELLDSLTQSIFLEMFGDPVANTHQNPIVEVGEVTSCIVPGRDKPKSFTGSIPWITTAELVPLGYTSASCGLLGLRQEEVAEVNARIIPERSVLMTCVGDLGVVSIAKIPMVINQQIHSFQCSDRIVPEYLMYALSHQVGYMYRRATQTTLPYMNKSVCNSIPIQLPAVKMQLQFKHWLHQVRAKTERAFEFMALAEKLFASVQSRAFSGQL